MPITILYEGTGANKNLKPTIDLVAIHGLNPTNKPDHAVLTWTESKSGHIWLKDAFPLARPSVRVLLYSYESSPVFGADKGRFIHQATTLLEHLRLIRRYEAERPLILVGYSLGGILIKQKHALVNAHNNPRYTSIKDSTFGLVFFGTPHSGPSKETKIIFSKTCAAIANSMPFTVSNDIMEALNHGSIFSDILYENWRHQQGKYKIISFYEGLGNIVPRESAVLGIPEEHQVRLNCNHKNMCRFNPSTEVDMDNYFLVQGNLEELCDLCPIDQVCNVNKYHTEELLQSIAQSADNPRRETISDEHSETFRWIWNEEDGGPEFSKWLDSEESIFWITGLPGSGKSTMMKYIFSHPRIRNYVSSQRNRSASIGHFFHELGESWEKTFEGLLSSILHQLIVQFEDLASLILPTFEQVRKKASRDNREPIWTEPQLRRAINTLISEWRFPATLLLFIDGLDECTGDHREELSFILRWVQLASSGTLSLRLILASRPLQEFEIRLAQFPWCKIHEFTADDISIYVKDNFEQTKELLARRGQNPITTKIFKRLVAEILQKAQGIFLWVELVVKNLIIGLEEGDSVEELENRLHHLPSDMELMYHRILLQIKPEYLHDTINYNSLLDSLSRYGSKRGLLGFTLGTLNPAEFLSEKTWHDAETHLNLKNQCSAVEVRIKTRCRGLIQVRDNSSRTRPQNNEQPIFADVVRKSVEYLHLTVREYLARETTSVMLLSNSDKSKIQDPMIAHLALCLRMLKLIPPQFLFQKINQVEQVHSPLGLYISGYGEDPTYLQESIEKYLAKINQNFMADWFLEEFLFVARLIEKETKKSPTAYMKECERICSLGGKEWSAVLHTHGPYG